MFCSASNSKLDDEKKTLTQVQWRLMTVA